MYSYERIGTSTELTVRMIKWKAYSRSEISAFISFFPHYIWPLSRNFLKTILSSIWFIRTDEKMLKTILVIVALAIIGTQSKTIGVPSQGNFVMRHIFHIENEKAIWRIGDEYCIIRKSNLCVLFQLGCSVNINGGLGFPQPLYVYSNTSHFVETTPNFNAFQMKRNQEFMLHCPSGFRSRGGSGKVKTLYASCVSGDHFTVENKTLALKELSCSNHPEHRVKLSNIACSVGDIIDIGFNVDKLWMPLMKICHDQWDGSTKWTHHRLTPSSALHQRNVPRPMFNPANLYKGIDVNKLYTRYVQAQTLTKLLKSEKLARQLIQDGNEYFLSRGHLAAKSDFVSTESTLAGAVSFFFKLKQAIQNSNDPNFHSSSIRYSHLISWPHFTM